MPEPLSRSTPKMYTSTGRWDAERPRVLVVCCSDGRLQQCMDEFLQNHLGIRDYDRFYAPGGPASLTPGGYEFLRASHYREDAAFLIRVHKVEELFLIFHGSATGGPEESTCAYYRRVMPGKSIAEIAEQQLQDLADVLMYLESMHLSVHVHAYRAEVKENHQIQFVPLRESRT